jgi:hypothetical protein
MNSQECVINAEDRVIWTLIPLTENYSRETTIAIYLRNPSTFDYRLETRVREILKAKGFTRIYLLFLFSKVGTDNEIVSLQKNELINSRCNEVINEIMPDVGSIVFAYGDTNNERVQLITEQRVAEVRELIEKFSSHSTVFCFGNLTARNNPKSIEQLQLDDNLNRLD